MSRAVMVTDLRADLNFIISDPSSTFCFAGRRMGDRVNSGIPLRIILSVLTKIFC